MHLFDARPPPPPSELRAGGSAALPSKMDLFFCRLADAADVHPWTPRAAAPLFPGLRTCHSAADARMRLRYDGEAPINASMCLYSGRHANLISDKIRRYGRWQDCDAIVREWRAIASKAHSDVLLEVGGNIGACTLEMLLRTEARIVVVEPSPTNLFLLTSTLLRASTEHPSLRVAERVVVLPIGLSNDTRRATLYERMGNTGDSMVHEPRQARGQKPIKVSYKIALHAFDELVTSGTTSGMNHTPIARGAIRLMKMDIQGYECRALAGMRRLLGEQQAVGALHVEVDLPHLRDAGCSQEGLFSTVRSYGFGKTAKAGRGGAWAPPHGYWAWDVLAVQSWAI